MITPIEKLGEKFRDLKVDPDTRILAREEKKIAGFDAVHEKWAWDGIVGESYIFASGDVAHLGDEELMKTVKPDPENATLKRGERYTFVNFGFDSPC
jgi:hypothetical protein